MKKQLKLLSLVLVLVMSVFAALPIIGVVADGEVCKIGSTAYTTLEDALAAASDGDTITMIGDYVFPTTSTVTIEKSVTIDLAGFNLSDGTNTTPRKAFSVAANKTVTATDSVGTGKITVKGAMFDVLAGATLNLDNVDMTNTATSSGSTNPALVVASGANAIVNVINGSQLVSTITEGPATMGITGVGAKINVTGSTTKLQGSAGITVSAAAEVNITDATVVSNKYNAISVAATGAVVNATGATITQNGDNGKGVSVTATATVTIDSCTLKTKKETVYAKYGTLTVKDSSVYSTGTYAVYTETSGNIILDGNGTYTAQSSDQPYKTIVYSKGGTITINGGKFEAYKYGKQALIDASAGSIVLNGGQYICRSNAAMLTRWTTLGANQYVSLGEGKVALYDDNTPVPDYQTVADTAGKTIIIANGSATTATFTGFTGDDTTESGSTVTMPDDKTPDNGGQLVGWKDASGKMYAPGAEVEIAKNTTFTAVGLNLTMSKGAGIRWAQSHDDRGIRFQTNVTDAELTEIANGGATISTGTLIAPYTSSVTDTSFTVDGVTALDGQNVVNTGNSLYKSNNYFYGGIKGMCIQTNPAQQGQHEDSSKVVTTKLAARGYVSVTYSDGATKVFYTAFSATDNVRSMQQIASAALSDTSITYSQIQKDILTIQYGATTGGGDYIKESSEDANVQ